MLSDKIISRIRHLRRRGWREGAQLEFKSAQGGIPRSMWETYSAFANTQGGFIILGVEDNGNIKGLPHPEKYRDDLFNQLNNAQRCSINLCSNEHICIMESEKKQILVLYVPQAKPQHRPVFLNGNEANCFMRDGSGDRRCTPEEIRRMRRNRDVVESQTSSHDSILIPYSSFDDVDYESLQRFRRRMLTTQMGATWIDLDDLSLLRRLGGYRKDRETGQEGLTLAGLLMFGRSESLHELRPYYRVDYFEYDNSNDISDRWIDRISNDGTWSGNLFDFFFRVYPKLQQGIKRPFRLNDDMTRQEETPADIALREALANAIIHADYYESFGIRIDNKPNGLFFTNPGQSPYSSRTPAGWFDSPQHLPQ